MLQYTNKSQLVGKNPEEFVFVSVQYGNLLSSWTTETTIQRQTATRIEKQVSKWQVYNISAFEIGRFCQKKSDF